MVKLRWLCKIIFKQIYSFFKNVGEGTGILALKLMFNRNLHAIERFGWLLVFMSAIYGSIVIIKLQIIRYVESPTVISVDRNYRGWEGVMPAITLCYNDHIDPFKASVYILENFNVSIVDNDYLYYMDFLNAVFNASVDNYDGLAKFAADEKFENVDLHAMVQAIEKPFAQIINTFDSSFEVSVSAVMTERGSCYSINSAMGEIIQHKSSIKNFDALKQPLKCKFGKQKCFMKIDLLESTGEIEVHSPFEISSIGNSIISLQNSQEIISAYKIMETVASSNLRSIRPERRKCVFHDEETAELKIYSRTLCLAKCRAMMALDMCNCVPFFYTFIDGPSCNPAGFECLFDFKWPIWTLNTCECPKTCTEIEYTLQTAKQSYWGMNHLDDTINLDVVTSSFRWDLIPPKVRFRRDVVFSYEDLLVSFGGILSLFLGLSIFSFISVFYAAMEIIFNAIYLLIKIILQTCCSFKKKLIRRPKLKKKKLTCLKTVCISEQRMFQPR